jgi:diguanylate cyclase (GGDEF)-like protein/PAS domain S-box-containing protein
MEDHPEVPSDDRFLGVPPLSYVTMPGSIRLRPMTESGRDVSTENQVSMTSTLHMSPDRSRRERALAWYAIHADEIADSWVTELWPFSPRVESKARFRRRITEIRDVFIHAIAADEPNASFERSQGIIFATSFQGNMDVLTAARTLFTRTMVSDLPLPLLPAVTRPFERTMTQFIWGYCDFATTLERKLEAQPAATDRPENALDVGWYREIIEQHPVAIAIFRATDRGFVIGNSALEKMFGYTVAEFGDVPDEDFLVDASSENDPDKAHELVTGKIPFLIRDQVFRHKDGRLVPFQIRQWNLNDANGVTRYIATECHHRDNEEARWQDAEGRSAHLSLLSVDPTFILDRNGRITFASPSTMRGLGVDPEMLTSRAFMELIVLEDHRAFFEFRRSLEECPRTVRNIELRLHRKDGQWRWFELTGSNLNDVPEIEGISIQARDITDRKRVEEWLSQQALMDPLTNLLNRRGIMSQLELVLERSRAARTMIGVLFIDLDRFHTINSRYGHEIGDVLLVEVGERLRFVLGGASSAARLGGDEFVVLLEDTSLEQITALADQIAAALSSPIEIGAHAQRVRANIGIVTSEAGRDTAMELLRAADAAQYRAKAAGDGVPVFHSDIEA